MHFIKYISLILVLLTTLSSCVTHSRNDHHRPKHKQENYGQSKKKHKKSGYKKHSKAEYKVNPGKKKGHYKKDNHPHHKQNHGRKRGND